MKKQVDKFHYEFASYVAKPRWASMWHQLDEVMRLKPERVLEIGPGPGVFKAMVGLFSVSVETLDIDPDLNPDHVASVFEMPFEDGAFDVVCAFQMLEHLPFDQSVQALGEMARVARRNVVISLPDARPVWPVSVHIPSKGPLKLLIPRPWLGPKSHVFDGEHYWEINKKGFNLNFVVRELRKVPGLNMTQTYRVWDCPYHRFFIFEVR